MKRITKRFINTGEFMQSVVADKGVGVSATFKNARQYADTPKTLRAMRT